MKNQGLNSTDPNFSNRKLFNVVEKTLLNKENSNFDEREKIWTSVAYMNQVQRALENSESRPNDDDYDLGWQVILDVAEIIQPDVIIKLGVEGFGRLGNLMANGSNCWQTLNGDGFRTKPERIVTLTKNNYNLKIIAVHHPTGTRGFDIQYWNKIISNNIPELKQQLDK